MISSENSPYVINHGSENTSYICELPSTTPTSSKPFNASTINLNELSVEISLKLKETMLIFHDMYWTYSFTPRGRISQFHGDPRVYLTAPDNAKHLYVLGRADTRIDFPKLEPKQSDDTMILTHTVANGSICDITLQPRKVEVQYFCDPEMTTPSLVSVREHRTCEYIAKVAIPDLCEIQELRPMEESFREIKCVPIVEKKDRDNKRNADDVFGAISEKVNVVDYKLISVDDGIFLGKPKQGPLVIFDIGDKETYQTRLLKSFLKWFPNRYIEGGDDTKKMLLNRLFFQFKALTYDMKGNYITTGIVGITRDERGQYVAHVDTKKVVVTENIELLNTPVPESGMVEKLQKEKEELMRLVESMKESAGQHRQAEDTGEDSVEDDIFVIEDSEGDDDSVDEDNVYVLVDQEDTTHEKNNEDKNRNHDEL
ncbi:Protein OS-9 [Cyberlindnera fabianii]|uniref:Endoplasmic reticulum lectin n=1 Tax=Cyberlindnera fabianii TaxID=36022 RepID=A0A1V2LDB3_CYBFA|nr:Protein OS-9 [Cyberlindnera fabianii]